MFSPSTSTGIKSRSVDEKEYDATIGVAVVEVYPYVLIDIRLFPFYMRSGGRSVFASVLPLSLSLSLSLSTVTSQLIPALTS